MLAGGYDFTEDHLGYMAGAGGRTVSTAGDSEWFREWRQETTKRADEDREDICRLADAQEAIAQEVAALGHRIDAVDERAKRALVLYDQAEKHCAEHRAASAAETMSAAKILAETTKTAAEALAERASKCETWHDHHAEQHGLTEKPPHILVANPVAYFYHNPKLGAWFLSAMMGLPAALACVLIWYAGSGGGLRILLQQTGLRAIYVPTSIPSTALPGDVAHDGHP